MISRQTTRLVLLLTAIGASTRADESSSPRQQSGFAGPTSVEAELEEDRIDAERSELDRWNAWKGGFKERTGLDFSVEYSASLQGYSDAGTGDDFSGGGIFRAYGRWTVLNRDSETNYGAIVFQADNRHRYTDFDPQTAGILAGSALPTATLYSDREWGLVNLHWAQALFGGKGGISIGWFPPDDYFNAYALASPLTAFGNLSFSTSGTIALPDSGIGAAGAAMLGDHWYVKAGVHDANGSASDPDLDVFGDWELYKNLEVGWTSSQDKLFLDNFHVGVWHADSRTDAGVPEDWGITFNASWYFEDSELLPFFRAGWSDGKAALLDGMVSLGMGKKFCERDLFGAGFSWGSPSAPGLNDQWTAELFYRKQLGNFAITPSLQWIIDPASNPGVDSLVVGGLRARMVF